MRPSVTVCPIAAPAAFRPPTPNPTPFPDSIQVAASGASFLLTGNLVAPLAGSILAQVGPGALDSGLLDWAGTAR